VQAIVDKHLTTAALAVAKVENEFKVKQDSLDSMNAAVEFLKDLDIDEDYLAELVWDSLVDDGAGRQKRKDWRKRLYQRLSD
jgi:hypothetical protein